MLIEARQTLVDEGDDCNDLAGCGLVDALRQEEEMLVQDLSKDSRLYVQLGDLISEFATAAETLNDMDRIMEWGLKERRNINENNHNRN